QDWLQSAVLSGDGKLLAAGRQQVHVWDPATGEKEAVLPNAPGKQLEPWHRWERLAFAPDGRSVAAVLGFSGALCLGDVATKKLVRAFGRRDRGFPHRDYAVPLLFTPDGRELATVRQDGALTLWSVATGRVRELGPAGMVHTFAFSPDGRFLAVAMER